MQYSKFNGKGFLILSAIVISFAACNSNGSSGMRQDTSTATATDRMDTTQQNEVATVPAEENAAPQSQATSPVQTTAPQENAAAATSSVPAATTSSNNETKKIIIKKKVEAVVEVVPVPARSKPKMERGGVYEYVEVGPQYPSGQAGIQNYLNTHMHYPPQALNNNVEGRVNVSFVVNEHGSITNAHIIGKGLSNGLNAEAVRLIYSMPGWRPGMIKGKPVKTRMTMPITFRIVG
ncbi:MAG: energy transducer TonB [Parafilimonas sp.]|nr:energy transducer TonB [Parafilimonas sp.]